MSLLTGTGPSGELLDLVTDASGNLKTVIVAGTALMGSVSIDQTTPGTTDKVTVIGKAADSAAASGNPVLTAGLYSATPATRHDGDAVTLQTTSTGALHTNIKSSDIAIPVDVQYNSTYITPAHTEASVGVTTTAVLAANADRKYALIQNDSDSNIYIMIGASAELNHGILLPPKAGYEMSAALGNLMLGAINGISTVAARNVLVVEGE